jgi:hypothetical protein
MVGHALQISWDKQNAFVKTALMAKTVKLIKELQQVQLSLLVSKKYIFRK